jgi:glycosyltransferase involved in cell wall biosynthesis
MRRRLDYWSARTLCATVITVSEAQRQAYLRAAGLDPTRVQTHLNGIDTEVFRPDPIARADLRAKLGLEPETVLFVTVAMLRPVKGVPDLLEAAALLRRQAPRVRYVIVGDGPERAWLERRAAALGLEGVVFFAGALSDVPSVLAAADVYVQPSLAEALPTSVLEAMAVCLPVVATSVGGVPEIVFPEQTGLLVPPGRPADLAAALARLLDPAVRAAMGAAGRAWVEQHASIQVWLDDLCRLYRRVV